MPVEVAIAVAEEALTAPTKDVQHYLRSLSDAYTLFAFLRETPDVQRAVTKMFSHGEIWLDTSVVLPLFAEELLELDRRTYTNMLQAAREAGLRLRITPGVLEEIERHMNGAVVYATRRWGGDRWIGNPPFLFVAYALSGRSRDLFSRWLERFRGAARPENDLAEFMEGEWGIEIVSLEEDAEKASVELRGAVQDVWQSVHDQRRKSGDASADPMTTLRLVGHDVENYLGVVMRRKREKNSAFGYTSWWMTLDRRAYAVRSAIRTALGEPVPDSPLISPDFMVGYLALGPLRARIPKTIEAALPLMTEVRGLDVFPAELLDFADELRAKYKDLDEYIIRRNVRDELDAARRRAGQLAREGLPGMEKGLHRELEEQASRGL